MKRYLSHKEMVEAQRLNALKKKEDRREAMRALERMDAATVTGSPIPVDTISFYRDFYIVLAFLVEHTI